MDLLRSLLVAIRLTILRSQLIKNKTDHYHEPNNKARIYGNAQLSWTIGVSTVVAAEACLLLYTSTAQGEG